MKMGLYLAIYLPNHPRATKDGVVYSHIISAEKKIGRYLKDGEVVHHINENKHDNREENLIVFKTNADHSAFHKGLKATLIGDVYECLDKNPKIKICPICNSTKILGASNMCKNCSDKNRNNLKKTLNIDREQLKKDIYYNSYTQLGLKYNVSDNTVKKWLLSFNIKECNKSIIKLIPYDEWLSEKFSEKTQMEIENYKNKIKQVKIKKNINKEIYQIDKTTKQIINKFNSIADANIFLNKNKNNGNIGTACRLRENHKALGYLWYFKEDYISL